MAIELVFETHSITEDNEWGRATGWLPGRLSPRGRELARELGLRRRDDGIAAVFSSDLRRAAETATLAFEDPAVPVLLDWRLRECDYGQRNGVPVAELHASRSDHLDRPYPGGESWRQAVARAARLLDELPLRPRTPPPSCSRTQWNRAFTALAHWIRGFMAFRRARSARIVVLMVPV